MKKIKRLKQVDLAELAKVEGGSCYCTGGSTAYRYETVSYGTNYDYFSSRQPYSTSSIVTTSYDC